MGFNRMFFTGIFKDDVYKNFPRWMRFLFYWPFWVLWHYFMVLFDYILRLTNETYAARTLKCWQLLVQQTVGLILVIAIVYVGLLLYRQFLELEKDMIARFNVNFTKGVDIDKILFNKITIISLFLLTIITQLSSIIPLARGIIPLYFTNIPISFVIESFFKVQNISIYFVAFFFIFMIFLFFRFFIIFSKNLTLTNQLKLHSFDKSGGFRDFSIFLLNITLVVTFFCTLDMIFCWVFFFYTESFDKLQFFKINIPFLAIPILSIILFFIIPQITIHRKIKLYKKNGLDLLWEKRNENISHEIKEVQGKIIIPDVDQDAISKIDLLIKDFESISVWPFRYSSLAKIFGGISLQIVIFLINYFLQVYVL